jgi:hypothetical protein
VEDFVAGVAVFTKDVVESVAEVVGALIGGEGASKAVKEFVERVGELVSALLGGNGASSGSAEGLVGRVASVMSELAQAIGGVLGGLFGGEDGAPAALPQALISQTANVVADVARALGGLLGVAGGPPALADYHLAAQPLAAYYHDYEQATAELTELTEQAANAAAAAAGELGRAASGALGGGGAAAPSREAGGVPAIPPLVPVAPPVAPGGYSSSFLVGSGSGAEAFQLLFAVLVVFSGALLRGGRLSWLRREAHGPPTAFTLAIERPG